MEMRTCCNNSDPNVLFGGIPVSPSMGAFSLQTFISLYVEPSVELLSVRLDWPVWPKWKSPLSPGGCLLPPFFILHLFCASHQEKLKAGGRECFVYVLQPVWCPDPTVSSFLAYLRGGSSVLLFQFSVESCFWSISPDLHLFVFLFALWDVIELHE